MSRALTSPRFAGALVGMLGLHPIARADEAAKPDEPPGALIRRALLHAGLARDEELAARARRSVLWPSLKLGAAVRRPRDPRLPTSWEVSAALAWPTQRVNGEEGRAARAARRASLLDRVAELWRSRVRLDAVPAPADPEEAALRRLRSQELDAEIEALTGEPTEEAREGEAER